MKTNTQYKSSNKGLYDATARGFNQLCKETKLQIQAFIIVEVLLVQQQ